MKTFLILLLSGCCSLAGIQTGPVAGGFGGATNVSLGTDGSVNVTTNGPDNWQVSIGAPNIAQAGGVTNQQVQVSFVTLTSSNLEATNFFTWNTFAGWVPLATTYQINNPGAATKLGDASGVYAPNTRLIMDNNGNYGSGNGSAITNITPANLNGLVTLVNTTNWIAFPAIGWTNNTTSTYYLACLTAGSSLTFKDGNGNGIWAITTSLPFVVGPGNKITGTGITGSLQQMPW